MKALLALVLAGAIGSAHASSEVAMAGCMSLAASMRSLAAMRDVGMPRTQAHATVDTNPGPASAHILAHNIVDLVYDHKDLTPQDMYDAGYMGCIEKLQSKQ